MHTQLRNRPFNESNYEVCKYKTFGFTGLFSLQCNEPVHDISNNMVCATSKASDQPANLIRAFASRLSII